MYHSDRDFTKSLMTPETSDDNSGSDDIDDGWEGHFESNMIALHTTAGRPPFDDLIAASYEQDYASTAIYLCGPEMMISSCKKAVGMSCQLSAQRLQMALKKNKFVFYEEKFEWSVDLTTTTKTQNDKKKKKNKKKMHCIYIYIYDNRQN